MPSPLATREAWLTLFTEKYLWPRIEAAEGKRPEKYRVSVGFPKGRRGSKGHSVGQCWSQEVSADCTCEIFISPELSVVDAVATLAHELVHASVGVNCGHRAPFKKLASRIGLTGPMRATVTSAALDTIIRAWIAAEPPYPHAPLNALSSPTRPGSRLLKAICEGCGYTVRVTRQWLDVAEPVCPDTECAHYREEMTCPEMKTFKRPADLNRPDPRGGMHSRQREGPG